MSRPQSTRPRWDADQIGDLTGLTAIVTGANSGIGLVTADQLAAHGATITLAVRDPERGARAADEISGRHPQARVEVRQCDLADLANVKAFAQDYLAAQPTGTGLDLLINNAGVMAIPRRESADGYEMQLATNHLGHFALTGELFGSLSPRARVVTVSSQAHRMGRIGFDDLMGERRYSPWRAYGQSKLANLLFTAEFARRLQETGSTVLALAAHPGYAATNLQSVGPKMSGSSLQAKLTSLGNRLFAQSAEMGALPTLFAATAPGLANGDYVGPDGFGEQRGHPRIVGRSAAARDVHAGVRLWEVSEDLTGVRFLDRSSLR